MAEAGGPAVASRFTAAEIRERFVQDTLPKLLIGGQVATCLRRTEWALLFVELARQRRERRGKPLYFTSMNGETISRCARDPATRALFEPSEGIAVDSMPVVLVSRLFARGMLSERAATTDLFHDVADLAQREGISSYFLGGTAEANAAAVRCVAAQYPGLRIVGARHGFFDFTQADGVIDEINAAAPDILWVCMGVPREQFFCTAFASKLTNIGIVKTGGGLLDFMSGRARRAPPWMQNAGLEWLFRLSLEPRRLFRRYLVTNLHSIFLLLTRPPVVKQD